MVNSDDLFTSYKLAAQLIKEKYFSLNELNEMMPFEINVYVDLINSLKKEEQTKNSNVHQI
jgi:hypothetical protein